MLKNVGYGGEGEADLLFSMIVLMIIFGLGAALGIQL